MSCPVCVINYNKTNYAEIKCMCDYSACKTCVRTYLLNTTQEPHCMKCRNKWSYDYIKNELGTSFVNKDLKDHQRKNMIESSISKREELIQGAINYRDDEESKKRIKELTDRKKELYKEVENINIEIENIENEIRFRNGQPVQHHAYYRYGRQDEIANGGATGGGAAPESKPTRKFVMPCQKSGCNGMLNTQYTCVICNTKTCPQCFEVCNTCDGEEHICNKDSIETASMIKKSTKPCPKCGCRISKIDGCDQIWCVECHTAFSWNTGEIETGLIHNPHYYQYMRERGELPRHPNDVQPGPIPCRPNEIIHTALRILHRFRQNSKNSKNSSGADRIVNYFTYAIHIRAVTVAGYEKRIDNRKTTSVTNEYLYILGRIDKETLGEKLMNIHTANLKDQAFLDIYKAIELFTQQIANDIVNSCNDLTIMKTVKTIEKWTAYFNMELIKSLMLHDSKRDIEIFDNFEKVNGKYKSKSEINSAYEKFSDIYSGKNDIVTIE